MGPDAEALHLFGAAALAIGLLLLGTGRAMVARGLVTLQAVLVALGAAAAASAEGSLWLAATALLLLAGHALLGWRVLPAVPPAPARWWMAAIGAGFVCVLGLALPQAAGLPREALTIGVGTALLGAVACCRPSWQGFGGLALANGVALAALLEGDGPVALAATLLSLAGAALLLFALRAVRTA